MRQTTPLDAMIHACKQLRERAQELMPPIGLRSILKLFEAKIVERHIQAPGLLEVHQGKYVVIVKKNAPWRRKRFTVAHEIGHVILFEALKDKPMLIRDVRSSLNWPYLEHLCNLAAGEILLPKDDFLMRVGSMGGTAADFRNLYDRYLCSWESILVRFVDLFPQVSASLWRVHARREGEQEVWRVFRNFGQPGKAWIPTGITCKHLTPNIICEAAVKHSASAANMTFERSSKKYEVSGIAFRLTRRVDRSDSTPLLFHGKAVPDEMAQKPTLGLLMWPRELAATDCNTLDQIIKRSA